MNNKLKCIFLIFLVFLSNCSRNDRKNNDIPQNFVENKDISIADEKISNESNYDEVIVRINELNQIILNNKKNISDNIISQIGKNIAEEIAACFVNRKPGTFSEISNFSKTENVSSINSIIPAAGYYIQQQARKFQGNSRAPEILILSVDNGNAYIREINVENGEIIVRNKIMLEFNGRTYAHNRTKLETENGNLQIRYLEHPQEQTQKWYESFEYEAPYTFAGYLSDLMPDMVYKLTSDYLITFTGEYIFESYKILDQINVEIDLDFIKNAVIRIDNNQEKKCLTIPVQEFPGFYDSERQGGWFWRANFVETLEIEPFLWFFGEGVGFAEIRYFFYKGGIAITHEYSGFEFEHLVERPTRYNYFKYAVFLKKILNRKTAHNQTA